MVLPRAFSLLRLLAENPGGLTLSNLSVSLGVPKSSLSSTLNALTDQEMLKRDGSLYFLGPESYSLASVILAGRSIRQIARPYLERAMRESEETILLAVADNDGEHTTYVDVVESLKPVRFTLSIGSRRPLYANASGRLFLAHFTDKALDAYLSKTKLEELTPLAVKNAAELKEKLAVIRENGVSVTLGDYSSDSAGFAAPIYNHDGEMVAAFTIGLPVSRGEREREKLIGIATRQAAEVSKILGYSADKEPPKN